MASYQSKYPERVRIVPVPGINAEEAWNEGWRAAKGEILGWLGSDDFYEPNAIITVVEFFRANPDVYFVFGDCNLINEKGEFMRKFLTGDFNLEKSKFKSI